MSWPVLPLGLLGSQASTAAPTTDNDTYQISRSLRFNSADSAYLSRTPSVAGNRKTWTWSGWVKKANSGIATFISADPNSGNRATSFYTRSLTDGRLEFEYFNGTTTYNLTAADLLRDPSSYYHLIIAVDTTQTTNTNRTKIYKNGVQLTLSGTYVPQDTDMDINSNVRHNLGRYQSANGGAISYFDGYLAEINFIDGQALTPSSFGETDATTGRWKAKAFSGNYGTNGFYLPFTNQGTTQNLLTHSEDFFNAAWTKHQSTVTVNAAVAPNGTTTAGKLIETASVGDHQLNRAYTAVDNTTYTLSAYVKVAERSQFRLYLQNKAGTYNYSDFNLLTGTVSSVSGVVPAISAVGDGWYRCSVTANVGTGATSSPLAFLSYGTATAGSGTNGLFVWGAQLEASSSAGPYMYTGASAQTSTLAIGADASVSTGGYNSWVANNLSVTPGTGNDSLTDSPSNYGAISTTLVDDTYQISKSLRFNSADSAYLSRTFSTPTSQNTWTYSCWAKFSIKAGAHNFGPSPTGGNRQIWYDSGLGTINWYNSTADVFRTSASFRDPSSWYHIVLSVNSGASGSNKVRLYVNGTEITSFSIDNRSSFTGSFVNTAVSHSIGRYEDIAANYFDGYLTEINFIDGQALTPTSFGTRDINTYLWKPKAYTGTYGTNGFYLPFSNNSSTQSLGWDQKGNITRYIAPGTYSYTVPTYSSSLVVEVWGGGGGGGQALLPGTDATNGGQSSFNGTVIANGGNRGVGASSGLGANGTGGTASGGDTNTTGNTGNSTTGVSSSTPSPNSGNSAIAGVVGPGGYTGVTGFPVGSGGGGAYWLGGSTPTSGAGGSGGYSKKTYAPSAISGTITVVVGAGGLAGIGGALNGGTGTDGMVRITVDGATTPSDWYQRNLTVDASSGNDSLVDSPTYYGTFSTTPSEDTYQMSKSVRFKGTNTTMARTPTVAGNRKTWTWSAWVKRSKLGVSGDASTVQQLFSRNDAGGVSNYTYLYFLDDNSIQFLDSNAGSAAGTSYLTTKAKFTDTTNWYHIVLAVDTTQAIESHRQKLYVNGTLTTSFTSISWLGLDSQTQIGTTNAHFIGSNRQTSQFFSGYFAEVNHIDGLALGADSFGVREAGTYLWKPKAYTGAYGTNGFSLKFSDSSTKAALGTDSSGLNNTYDVQGNDFSVATGTLTVVNNDSFIDVPTYYGTDNGAGGEARGNYCTWNSLNNTGLNLAHGNLDILAGGTDDALAKGTVSVSSGKWYWEATCLNISGVVRGSVGLSTGTQNLVYFSENGNKYINGSGSAYGAIYSTGDVIGVALDADNGTLTFYRNNTSQGTAFTGLTSSPYFPLVSTAGGGSFAHNFGQRAFKYTAPAGFKALRDYNKPPVPNGGEVRGNYCTWNPLRPNASMSYANGNLDATSSGGSGRSGYGTFGMSSGKWYFETTGGDNSVGVATFDESVYAVYNAAGSYNINGTTTSGKTTYTTSDVIGCAYNADANTIEFFKNGSSQGSTNVSAAAGLPVVAQFSGTFSVSRTCVANFGQRPWAYGAPFGFKPLRDYNKLPTPTGGEVRGNYATLNPLHYNYDGVDLRNGNLDGYGVLTTTVPSARTYPSTIKIKSGKWYVELTVNATSNGHDLGIANTFDSYGNISYSNGYGYNFWDQSYLSPGGSLSYGVRATAGQVVGMAVDLDNGKLEWFVNGSSQGQKTGIISGEYFIAYYLARGTAGTVQSGSINFGQRPWAYDAPFGFKPLCTTLLPQPIVQKSSTAMDVVTYTGNGSNGRVISGLNFSPDLVWTKSRSAAYDHALSDTVRGVGFALHSNTTAAEDTSYGLAGVGAGNYTINAVNQLNESSITYVAWAWDKSPIAGLDIVSYTGDNNSSRTISHTLGVVPSMIILKPRSGSYGTEGWQVWHKSLSASNVLQLHSNAAQAGTGTFASGIISSSPTASVFGFTAGGGGVLNVNASSTTYIAYLFSEVEGFSKFGSYTGNGLANGPFVYCGFRPRFVMVKTTGTEVWIIKDTARSVFNGFDVEIYPNSPAAEGGPYSPPIMDYLSNGFKLRSNTSASNASQPYIFAAFAESPFKYSRAR